MPHHLVILSHQRILISTHDLPNFSVIYRVTRGGPTSSKELANPQLSNTNDQTGEGPCNTPNLRKPYETSGVCVCVRTDNTSENIAMTEDSAYNQGDGV